MPNLRAALEVEAGPRELLREYLVQRVKHGVVRDRADVVAALQDAGLEVPRKAETPLVVYGNAKTKSPFPPLGRRFSGVSSRGMVVQLPPPMPVPIATY